MDRQSSILSLLRCDRISPWLRLYLLLNHLHLQARNGTVEDTVVLRTLHCCSNEKRRFERGRKGLSIAIDLRHKRNASQIILIRWSMIEINNRRTMNGPGFGKQDRPSVQSPSPSSPSFAEWLRHLKGPAHLKTMTKTRRHRSRYRRAHEHNGGGAVDQEGSEILGCASHNKWRTSWVTTITYGTNSTRDHRQSAVAGPALFDP